MKYLLEAGDAKMQAWKDQAKLEGVSFAEWLRRAADGALMEPEASRPPLRQRGVVGSAIARGGLAGDTSLSSGSVSVPSFVPAAPNVSGVPFRGGKRSYEPDPR